ncbi:PREDICTED: probable transmembrane ascorbate ferrireductase 3 [Nicotiana attenuata]|uniref:Transmembrane ascorbate ferrireductase 3 n=1 Tax=Nicotiana attenuata TaxID=49451 RepID=A0A314L5F0_NICAT|nr:PREDICTED: probable transmembrane ascorbate ferrireductase 3 [Nicotiana attenuata]OIT36783.1 putative transmembrane ascorbate ferrireductase 3 [Nicotiana attenuata]
MDPVTYQYYRPASRITIFAHLFGLLALILMLVWLLHYREGVNLFSYYANQIFNVHPLLMFLGMIFLSGQALMAYKTERTDRKVQKVAHFLLHLAAICLGIVGIHAAFKYHDRRNLRDMYSFHSWIGIATICLYILQVYIYQLNIQRRIGDLNSMGEFLTTELISLKLWVHIYNLLRF